MKVYQKPGAWEAVAGRSQVQGQSLLHRKFRTSLGYMKLYLKSPKTSQPNVFKNILHFFTYSLRLCVGASTCYVHVKRSRGQAVASALPSALWVLGIKARLSAMPWESTPPPMESPSQPPTKLYDKTSCLQD